jgi:SAM-dependent methyltransferase
MDVAARVRVHDERSSRPMTVPYSHPVSARAYDALYKQLFDYEGASAGVLELIRLETGGRETTSMTLLDVGCGTGRHLEILEGDFASAVGVEPSEVQLSRAAERLGASVRLRRGDMRTLRDALGDAGVTFDVVICLFSCVAYLDSGAELAGAISEMAAVLRPGGVLIIEPGPRPNVVPLSPIIRSLVDEPGFSVARMAVPVLDGVVTDMDLHFLVGHDGVVDHYVEHHRLRSHTEEEFGVAFHRAGLNARFDGSGLDQYGRGVWIATKPVE